MRIALLLFATLLWTGCGRPFEVDTPNEFVELEGQEPKFDYRATTADGVVVAVRTVEARDRNDLAFWEKAIRLRMRNVSGYALLDTKVVQSADGTPGRQLRFGREENGTQYRYWVTFFIAQDRIFLHEAGGAEAKMTEVEPRIEQQVAGFRARCGSVLAPVLASRTCNRW